MSRSCPVAKRSHGRKKVGDQFLYRFNTDERSVVAAVAQFHRGLWLHRFRLYRSADPIGLFAKPEFLALPTSAIVRPLSFSIWFLRQLWL